MSETTPVELIVAAFQDEKGADEALKALKQAKKEHVIAIQDAAVLRMDEKGKVHIKEVHDVGGGKGAVAGGLLGAGIALLTGPAGIILAGATGALVGGLAAKNLDFGLDNKRLKKLGESLKPGTSAIVAIIEHVWVDQLEAELAEAGADVLTEALSEDIHAQLEAGREVATSALMTEEGADIARVSAGEDAVELSEITMTDEGVAAKAAVVTPEGTAMRAVTMTEDALIMDQAVVTKEGFVAEELVATEEGAVDVQVAGTFEEPKEEEEEKKDEYSSISIRRAWGSTPVFVLIILGGNHGYRTHPTYRAHVRKISTNWRNPPSPSSGNDEGRHSSYRHAVRDERRKRETDLDGDVGADGGGDRRVWRRHRGTHGGGRRRGRRRRCWCARGGSHCSGAQLWALGAGPHGCCRSHQTRCSGSVAGDRAYLGDRIP